MNQNNILSLTYNKEFRHQIQLNPKSCVTQLGIEVQDDVNIIVKTNTKNTFYVLIPTPNIEEIDVSKIQAAAGSHGTLSSASTLSSSVGSFSSTTTAGCK